jgi:hypothetical protein
MRFPYLPLRVRRLVPPLGGLAVRFYPVFAITVSGSRGPVTLDALVDSGADDTIFPERLAAKLGIDLTQAPQGDAATVSGAPVRYRYSPVNVQLRDGRETLEWTAQVGFAPIRLRWALLGQTGFLQYLDVTLYGGRREVEIVPNPSFPGLHVFAP